MRAYLLLELAIILEGKVAPNANFSSLPSFLFQFLPHNASLNCYRSRVKSESF